MLGSPDTDVSFVPPTPGGRASQVLDAIHDAAAARQLLPAPGLSETAVGAPAASTGVFAAATPREAELIRARDQAAAQLAAMKAARDEADRRAAALEERIIRDANAMRINAERIVADDAALVPRGVEAGASDPPPLDFDIPFTQTRWGLPIGMPVLRCGFASDPLEWYICYIDSYVSDGDPGSVFDNDGKPVTSVFPGGYRIKYLDGDVEVTCTLLAYRYAIAYADLLGDVVVSGPTEGAAFFFMSLRSTNLNVESLVPHHSSCAALCAVPSHTSRLLLESVCASPHQSRRHMLGDASNHRRRQPRSPRHPLGRCT